jgi:hypothetical protein
MVLEYLKKNGGINRNKVLFCSAETGIILCATAGTRLDNEKDRFWLFISHKKNPCRNKGVKGEVL